MTSPSKPASRIPKKFRSKVRRDSDAEKGFEKRLVSQGIQYEYEPTKFKYIKPVMSSTYTPDFYLPHLGFFIEYKSGSYFDFDGACRTKMLAVKSQYPDLDIRFIFERENVPIFKGSKTTQAMWCEKHGFKYAFKRIPSEWINENE